MSRASRGLRTASAGASLSTVTAAEMAAVAGAAGGGAEPPEGDGDGSLAPLRGMDIALYCVNGIPSGAMTKFGENWQVGPAHISDSAWASDARFQLGICCWLLHAIAHGSSLPA